MWSRWSTGVRRVTRAVQSSARKACGDMIVREMKMGRRKAIEKGEREFNKFMKIYDKRHSVDIA